MKAKEISDKKKEVPIYEISTMNYVTMNNLLL